LSTLRKSANPVATGLRDQPAAKTATLRLSLPLKYMVPKIKSSYLTFLLLLSLAGSAQNEFSKWFFGLHAGLDFMNSPPSVISHTTLSTYEGSATISDISGNLLFYTDGITIWNKQMLVMPNGTGLMGNSSTVQSALIIKQQGNANIYYCFTLDLQGGPNGLRYSVVDMNLAGGTGSVTLKNIPLIAPCTEQLAGTRHCNGKDVWVVTHAFGSNNFYSYLVSATGVNTTPVVSPAGPSPPTFTPNMTAYGQGSIKINKHGKKLGLTFFNGSPNNCVGLFDFDRSSGTVSNFLNLLNVQSNSYGCEFSPDGSKFYTSVVQGSVVLQWDVCAGTNAQISASQQTVSTVQVYGQFQAAPDGKIYVIRSTTMLSAISNPNIAGTGCNFVANAVAITAGTASSGLPNFVSGVSNTIPPPAFTITSADNCKSVLFDSAPFVNTGCAASGYSLLNKWWEFGDPLSGPSNTSAVQSPTHVFGSPGSYTVKLIYDYACGADTLYLHVTAGGPQISITASQNTLCTGQQATLQASGTGVNPPFSYSWTSGPSGPTYLVSSNLSGLNTYTVSATDQLGCQNAATVQLQHVSSPSLSASGATVCPKTSVTLTASGAGTYTWLPNLSNSPQLSITPASTTVYTVQGANSLGCSATRTVMVFVSNCNLLPEIKSDEAIIIYPGISSGEVVIESKRIAELSLYDVFGLSVRQIRIDVGKSSLSLHGLAAGVYLVRTAQGFVKKIIKE
jgi:hypothetical protein